MAESFAIPEVRNPAQFSERSFITRCLDRTCVNVNTLTCTELPIFVLFSLRSGHEAADVGSAEGEERIR